jgi:hypothetical protein
MMKPRRMRRKEQMTQVGKNRNAYRILVGKPKEGDCLRDTGVDGRLLYEP